MKKKQIYWFLVSVLGLGLLFTSTVFAVEDKEEIPSSNQVGVSSSQEPADSSTSDLLEPTSAPSSSQDPMESSFPPETTNEPSTLAPSTDATTSSSSATEVSLSEADDAGQDAITEPESATGEKAMYRLYHPITGEHLYTTDLNEKNVLYQRRGWGYEGIAWYAPTAGTPVYRLYNAGLQNHLYTSDTNEVKVLTSRHGWTTDNNGRPVFYSGGEVGIYRLYNPKLRGLHHWTTDANEYRVLPSHGWHQEGISFKGTRMGSPIRTRYASDEVIAANIKSFGGYAMTFDSKRELVAAIKELSRQRYSIGFMIMDVRTQKGIEYNADQQFYAASTVKGPFVASLAAKNPASIQESGAIMRQVLSLSSNEGYSFLVNRYRFTSWYPWLAEAGVRSSIGNDLYPHYSARELLKLWQRNYTYFTNDKTGQQVGLWFENPNLSPIKSVLGSQYRTRSKAGWIAGWGLYSASDGGIVYAKSGPYIIAIMTDANAQLNQLNGTVKALNTLVSILNESHTEMIEQAQ